MRLYRASFPPSVNRSSLKLDGHHPLSHHESPSGSRKIRLGVDTNPITRRCLARTPDAAALLHDTTGGCARLVDRGGAAHRVSEPTGCLAGRAEPTQPLRSTIQVRANERTAAFDRSAVSNPSVNQP